MKKIIAVCGNASCPEGTINYELAYSAGKAIIDHGYRLQCGGLRGVMLAACKGARSSKNYKEGDIIGIIPSFDLQLQTNMWILPFQQDWIYIAMLLLHRLMQS